MTPEQEAMQKAFNEMCSCGFKRLIIARKPFLYKWCTRCDGDQVPPPDKVE